MKTIFRNKIFLLIVCLFNLSLNSAEVETKNIDIESNGILYRIEPELVHEQYYTFKLYNKDKCLGYLTSRMDNQDSVIGYIRIYDDFQKKGYGKLLLQNVCFYLTKNGIKLITLLPYPSELKEDSPEFKISLENLCKFYIKCGFIKSGEFMVYKPQNDIK